MADNNDDEIQQLEEAQRKAAERLEKLRAEKANEQKIETSRIELGQDATIRSDVAALGTKDGLSVELPTRQMDTDTRNSIIYNTPDGRQIKTHEELTGEAKEAVLQKAGINDGVERNVYARTQKVPTTISSGGKDIETVVERTEYIISKDPTGARGLVLPKAVLTEERTTDKEGKPIGSSSVAMVDGQPIKVHVEYADGKEVDKKITVGKDSVEIETMTNGKEAPVKTYDKKQLLETGERVEAFEKQIEEQAKARDAAPVHESQHGNQPQPTAPAIEPHSQKPRDPYWKAFDELVTEIGLKGDASDKKLTEQLEKQRELAEKNYPSNLADMEAALGQMADLKKLAQDYNAQFDHVAGFRKDSTEGTIKQTRKDVRETEGTVLNKLAFGDLTGPNAENFVTLGLEKKDINNQLILGSRGEKQVASAGEMQWDAIDAVKQAAARNDALVQVPRPQPDVADNTVAPPSNSIAPVDQTPPAIPTQTPSGPNNSVAPPPDYIPPVVTAPIVTTAPVVIAPAVSEVVFTAPVIPVAIDLAIGNNRLFISERVERINVGQHHEHDHERVAVRGNEQPHSVNHPSARTANASAAVIHEDNKTHNGHASLTAPYADHAAKVNQEYKAHPKAADDYVKSIGGKSTDNLTTLLNKAHDHINPHAQGAPAHTAIQHLAQNHSLTAPYADHAAKVNQEYKAHPKAADDYVKSIGGKSTDNLTTLLNKAHDHINPHAQGAAHTASHPAAHVEPAYHVSGHPVVVVQYHPGAAVGHGTHQHVAVHVASYQQQAPRMQFHVNEAHHVAAPHAAGHGASHGQGQGRH